MPVLKGPLLSLLATPFLLLGTAAASASARLVPEDAVQFERIALRQTVDSCVFAADRVQVTFKDSVIKVVQPGNQCLVAGPPAVVDIQLGAFPPGEYSVEIHAADDQPAEERIRFTVSGLVLPAVFPPPPLPLNDYSGVWWNEDESGWGLSLHHSPLHTVFGALFVFDAGQQPHWYTLGNGQWESSTRWTGEIVHSTGPDWSAASFSAAAVQHSVTGSATLDFSMVPGREDLAELSYTIDGTTVTKTISRARF